MFIPLTKLCRDVCHYCTFAKAAEPWTSPTCCRSEVLDIARRGQAAGCTEALFTLGDKPELRYRAAREALAALGYATHDRLPARHVRAGARGDRLLPHVNPGVMTREEIAALRELSVSRA